MYLMIGRGKNIPCIFDMSWQKKGPMGIVFKIHKDFIVAARKYNINFHVNNFIKTFKFSEFKPPFEKVFGFQNAFTRIRAERDYIIYLVKIPRVRKYLFDPCPKCLEYDSQQPDLFNWKLDCPVCKNTGKVKRMEEFGWGKKKHASELNMNRLYAIAASMNIFFRMVQLFAITDNKTSSNINQLIAISTVVDYGMGESALTGDYSRETHEYLASLNPKTSITEMREAMLLSHQRMVGFYSDIEKYSFRSNVDYENGWLNVDVPGNACGLNPMHNALMDKTQTDGYSFCDHNLDNPIQQISLLSGLAALNNVVRRNLNSKDGS